MTAVARACQNWLASALVLGWLLLIAVGPALAESPSPGPGYAGGGDTRSAGQGPGLQGSPLYAIGGVIAIALVSIGITLLYLRLTPAGPKDPPADGPGAD